MEKKYHFSQLLHRMRLLAENCDYMIILNNEYEMNPQLQTAYSKIQKLNKKASSYIRLIFI